MNVNPCKEIDIPEPYVMVPFREYNELWEVVRWLEELNDLGVVSLNDYDFSWLRDKVKIETMDVPNDS